MVSAQKCNLVTHHYGPPWPSTLFSSLLSPLGPLSGTRSGPPFLRNRTVRKFYHPARARCELLNRVALGRHLFLWRSTRCLHLHQRESRGRSLQSATGHCRFPYGRRFHFSHTLQGPPTIECSLDCSLLLQEPRDPRNEGRLDCWYSRAYPVLGARTRRWSGTASRRPRPWVAHGATTPPPPRPPSNFEMSSPGTRSRRESTHLQVPSNARQPTY